MKSRDNNKLLFVALGNDLMGDDSVGLRIGRKLKKEGYKVIECGTDIFKLINTYRGEKEVVVIDALLTEEYPPGTVLHFKGEDIFFKLDATVRSAHYMGAIDALKVIKYILPEFRETEFHFVGITIESVQLGMKTNLDIDDVLKNVKAILNL